MKINKNPKNKTKIRKSEYNATLLNIPIGIHSLDVY